MCKTVTMTTTDLCVTRSHRWSFGVVAWEILTYGTYYLLKNAVILVYCLAEMPYGMENFARSIKGMVQHLKSGGRLPCPSVPHAPVLYVSVLLIQISLLLMLQLSHDD